MEPTLVAVLAVESVKKLELVGDHRQLPAFISQCWYNLELSMPSIKTSLFERIIMTENHKGHPRQRKDNICSILDVQRRMRTSISNLTKSEYADIVAINDHNCTQIQKIGDKISNKSSISKYWEFKGRSIPGLSSCIYFWDLENNSESKPIAGLSACNEKEALSIVALVKYLQLCGVSDECITIITPYSGQKRLLVNELKEANCLPHHHQKQQQQRQQHSEKKSIIVSTVDRYQGDENDIVILSLVRTRPGNRFVGLLNRFIVAASRARLGFYIVGSLSAVVMDNQGLPHWKRFVEHLSQPDLSGCDSYRSSRVGSDLPICCPVHHVSTKIVSSRKESRQFPNADNWNILCTEKCTTKLDCGHQCLLNCHFPNPDVHNPKCQIKIPRPCETHSTIPLYCYEISRKNGEPTEQALARWKCECENNYQLKCGHKMKLKCFQVKDIRSGDAKLPPCEVIVEDYIHPQCGHHFSQPLL